MKPVIKINLFLVPILALLLVLSPFAPAAQATALFHGGLEPQNWTLTGPGTRTRQPASGPTGSIVFNYVYNGHYGQWHTWDFYTTPTTTETITFPWRYQPFHSWYQSKSRLYVFTNGTSGPMTNLVDSYGIIDVNGTVTVNVVAGQTFGFRMQAYHFDGSNITNGTLTVGTPVPYLSVSGSTTFTENAAPVVVAPGLTLTGPDIDGAKASIGTNFNAAQDSLGISGQTGTSGTVSGITWSYNATTGVMALSGAATAATYQAALRQVTFSNNSQNPSSAPRTVTFSIGQNTLYYPGTGHYYEYVSAPGMYWTDARTAAEARYYYGLQGYLVTIMDAGENSFASSKITGMGWMGGSDSAVEGTWRWVTGPEAGTLFSGHYTNWASGEPNNLGNEDYAHFYTNGLWNDFYNNNGSIQGYVVEYGGAPGDPSLSLSGSVTVNIQPVNDPPVANNGSATTNEDTAKAITLTGSDVEGSALTFAIATAPAHGTATVAGSTATYTPALNYSGPDSFTFRASDGSLASAPATINMTVNPVNDAPAANGASVSTNEDTSKAITLTGSDVEGSTLTFTIADAPDHGTVSGTAPNVTYAPAANFNGADSFTFTVNDGSLTSNAATISITVSPVNDAPVANNASVTTNEDTAKAITLTGSDVEGSALTYSIVTAPAHGTANIAGSVATYTPATSYSGPDSFTFRANDGSLNSAPATIAITVNSVDDAPTANAGGPYSVAEGGTVTLSGSGSDPDGGAVALEWDLNNDGQFDDANGAHPTFSAAGIDGPGVRNISLRVSERAGLFWDFENATSNGGISTSVGAAAGPKTSGIASQTGGGPVEDWGAPIGKVLLTRGLGPVNYPYMEFATTEVLQLDSVSFTHYHNHNPGYPTYNGYQVQLQINSGGGYSNLGSPLAINRNNNGQTSTMAGGSLSLNPGTYRIRWLASGFSSGDNSSSEYFGINDLSLNLVSVLKATSSTTVTINNVAPTVNAGSDANTNGAGLFTGSGSFTDPGPDTWTATVDYGDGSGVQPLALTGKTFNLSHTYPNAGVYTVTVSVNDGDSGGTATDTLNVTRPDTVAPTTTAARDVQPNPAGWNKTNVTVTFSAVDNTGGSGVKEIRYSINGGAEVIDPGATASLTLSTDGQYNITYYAKDNAGNSETGKSLNVNVDKTPPTIVFNTASPAPNGAGWNKTNVSVPFVASDALSGVASTTPAASQVVLIAEGAAVTGSATVTDVAGNTATFTTAAFKIDKTAPTLVFGAASPVPNGAGWNNTNVSVPFTPGDALSGVASTSPAASPVVISAEGAAVTGTATVTDVAGNTASFTTAAFKIDKTAPTISGSRTPDGNANGWNNSDVTVHFTASDALSGMASVTPDTVLSGEGANQSVTGTAVDIAGNSAATTIGSISIDKTKPTLVFGALNPAPNGAGWNKTDVTIGYTPADALSGVASSDPANPLSFTAEGANLTQTVTVMDKAGNTNTFTSPVVKLDKTAPTLVFGAASPVPNGAGWNNANVSVPFTAGDALSGVGSTSPAASPVVVSAEGVAVTGTVTVTDVAGNVASFTTAAFKIDKTAPTVSGSRSPGANTYGWNNTDVTVHFTASDTLSGMASLTPDTVLSGEGANQSVTGTAIDVAGNSATATVGSISIDKTKPTLSFGALNPVPNAAGWNNSNVTIGYTPADALSGVASSDPANPLSFTAEGSNLTQTVTVMDKAGNTNTFTSPVVKLDKTAPTLVFGAASPVPNGAGWNNTNVSVPFTASDALSGVGSTSPAASPVVVSAEGAAVTGTVTVTDVAGNTATFTTAALKIDKTAPTIQGSRSPGANTYGWNNTDVTVHFTGSDTLSGVASLTPDTVLSAEAANQSVTGTVVDIAGNSATATVGSISIDKTKPTLAFGPTTPAPNAAGWNRTDATIAYTTNDTLSGVASATPASPLSFTTQGAALTQTVTVADKAGNTNTFISQVVKLDKTLPTVGISSPQAKDYLTSESFTVTYTNGDALSGVALVTAKLDTTTVTNGQVINLASMAGNHTLVVTVTDVAGNTNSASVSFRVIIAATIVINPQTLNLKSQSDKNAITAFIEFPTGYSVAQINVASIKLDVVGTAVPAQLSPTSVGDDDGDGVPDRMVKADRQSFITPLTGKTGDVTIVVTGTLTDGRAFTCRATINVINPGK